jgi:hypothetical protein
MADVIGLDFNSQFVIGFVAVCVEDLLHHMGADRDDNSGFGELGRNILTLSDVGEDGVFVFYEVGYNGGDRIRLRFGTVTYVMCCMWTAVLAVYGVAPLAGHNDEAVLQLKVIEIVLT